MISLSSKFRKSIYSVALLVTVGSASFVAVQPAFAKENSMESAGEMSMLEKPLLVIRYNQRNVYFEPAVKKIVDVVEVERFGATYQIESVIPAQKAADNNMKIDPKDDKNLLSVLAYLNELAVPMDRVIVNSVYSTSVKNQEIKFFIK